MADKRLLIGTNNPAKQRFFQENCLKNADIELLTPGDIGCHLDIPETAGSASEIALQKAKAWHEATGLPVVAQDSGMLLLDLPEEHPDQPGVMVRRVAGRELTDDEMAEWYRRLACKHGGMLRFAWVWAWCFYMSEDAYVMKSPSRADLEHNALYLVDEECHTKHEGWPIDSITRISPDGKYLSELAYDELNWEEDSKAFFPEFLRDIQRMLK